MALSNNEKQIRHKRLENLKKAGKEVLFQLILSNSMMPNKRGKTNEIIQAEIENIVNLPSGWTEEDFTIAEKKLNNLLIETNENPHLLHNDIYTSIEISNHNFDRASLQQTEYKAHELVEIIKSTLNISGLSKSNQIAVIVEVNRQLGKELLLEKNIPNTFANAAALSLISHQYEKPEWTCNVFAEYLCSQCSKENINELISNLNEQKR